MNDPMSSFDLAKHIPTVAVNNDSVMIALQESIKGFRTLTDANASKTFIFTGNACNVGTRPNFMSFGIGKLATSYAIQTLVEWDVYQKEGIK